MTDNDKRVWRNLLLVVGIGLAIFLMAVWLRPAHAQSPTLQEVYGWGAGEPYSPRANVYRWGFPFAYAPVAPAPAALGWIYGPYTFMAPDGVVRVSVGADGLNIRTVPEGPVIGALANGVPVIPLTKSGPWVLVAPACTLVPTWTFSVTAGVPLSVCGI